MTTQRQYHAYLLRLWRDSPQQPWYAMLENPRTGERHSFTSREEMFRFLATQMDGDAEAPPADSIPK
jgi:muconolactone delta-isomerase